MTTTTSEAGAGDTGAMAGAAGAGDDGHPAGTGPVGAARAVEDAFAAVQAEACDQLAGLVGRARACRATGLPRSSWYRANRASEPAPRPAAKPHVERVQPRALSPAEREAVRELLNSAEHVDAAPATVWAKLLDAGQYYCSISTMYRILREHDEVRERRRQATHPARKKPELIADAPNRVWSWDITKLAGPERGIYYHAYVIIDIFSRYNPGWMIAETENAELARRFLHESITKHGVDPDTLTLHADRGTSMKSKSVAELLADLHVTKSHSRPQVSNDNPYSESQFKTFKYRPIFPTRFDSIGHAREFAGEFFDWYNHDHRHSGIGLHVPYDVHHGLAEHVRAQRCDVLTGAYATHPERFVRGTPQPPKLPGTVWINRPAPATAEETPTNPTK